MKKVLLVTFSDNPDHQDICFGMFESVYAQRRNDVDIWLMGTNHPKMPVIDTPNTYLVDCPKRPGIEKKTFDFKELRKIITWINAQNFDVIFFETLHVWNLAIMLCCHKHTLIFQMIHDIIPHPGDKQEKNVHMMNKAVCKMADYIVLCNQKYVLKVTEIYGVPQERIRSIDMWRRFPEYTEPRYSKRVLFFGRMNPYKGINNLLKIAQRCPEIKFDVVGRAEPQTQDLADELKKLPNVTMNNVYVTDKEMAEAFMQADWIVLPYNSATQSGVIIDSYRYGRPCIAFNVGAIAEQISEGVSGYLIPEGNITLFVEKLKEAISMTESEYREMSRNAYEYGLKKYSADGAVDRFMKLIS